MTADLAFPQVPEAKPEDLEDVSWALSTAEAMWARGDHAEGIKWVRRAAEAASEAEADERALELAKAAADLTNLLSRLSMPAAPQPAIEPAIPSAPIEIEEVVPVSEQPMAAPPIPEPPPLPGARTGTSRGWPPVKKPSSPPPAAPTARQSRPPAPLPSRTSSPPPARNKPLGTNTNRPEAPVRPPAPPRAADKPKRARRSRENIEVAAEPRFRPSDTAETATIDVPFIARRRPEDPTVASNVNDIVRAASDEWDVPAPVSSSSEDVGERMTTVGFSPEAAAARAAAENMTLQMPVNMPSRSEQPPTTVEALPQIPVVAAAPVVAVSASPSVAPHDPALMTSQAVRVLVWRDASGVHVAPAGTVVSAITVEAVLVALEPNADLTAWLSPKSR